MNPFDDHQPSRANATTNPFEDDDDLGGVEGGMDVHKHKQGGGTATTTNPFEDDNHHNRSSSSTSKIKITSNPFDDDEDDTNNNNNDDDDDDDNNYEHQQRRRVKPDPIMPPSSLTSNINPASSASSPSVIKSSLSQQQQQNGGVAAEASWQYLGDLPYRRIPIYNNVSWDGGSNNDNQQQHMFYSNTQQQRYQGLAAFPASVLEGNHLLDPREIRQLLNTTTTTKVTSCPHGGPIAAITLPIVGEAIAAFTYAELRIMTNAGNPVVKLQFPPKDLQQIVGKRYAPSDILTIGFTDRTTLIVVLRDSLCLTYNLKGEYVLKPFYILPIASSSVAVSEGGKKNDRKGMELLQATVYDGGVAVLSTNQHAAIVELLDDHDDPDYYNTSHVTARRIFPPSTGASQYMNIHEPPPSFGSYDNNTSLPPNYAIVTHLPTQEHANHQFFSYLTIAVLSRYRTASKHPEVFISTTDNSVIIVNVDTLQIIDVECRQRISSPIVDMTFAPNGRFLACFTQSSMLTVISTSFETKVLDFDTSEGSSSPPLDMKWCGEDSVVLHWKNLGILMVGPYGDWLRFPYENDRIQNLHLIPEIDCCRVITDVSVEILQRVPPATALLLRIGSIEPSAMLLDASDAFECGSPASEEAARAIIKTGQLQEAIETCTEAATKEFDIATQKRLLRAASYGLHFSYKDANEQHYNIMGGKTSMVDVYDDASTNATVANATDGSNDMDNDINNGSSIFERPSLTTIKFVNAAKKLRILNALRNSNVGFLLTSLQYDAITPAGLIARLIAMKRPSLATSISQYLNLSKNVQLYARASKASALIEYEAIKASLFPNSNNLRSDTEIADAAIQLIHNNKNNDKTVTSISSISSSSLTGGATLSFMNRGGYATVALAANKVGRPGIANLLLMLETSVADKVPALISTGSYADAMAVATSARDVDLIFATLMEFEKACIATAAGSNNAAGNGAKSSSSKNKNTNSSSQQKKSSTDNNNITSSSETIINTTFIKTVVSKFTPEGFNTLRRYYNSLNTSTTANPAISAAVASSSTTNINNDLKQIVDLLLRAQKFADAGTAIVMRAIDYNAKIKNYNIRTGCQNKKNGKSSHKNDNADSSNLKHSISIHHTTSTGQTTTTTTATAPIITSNIDPRERQIILLEASRVFGLGKETAFHKSCTDDYLELLKDQEVLRTKYGAHEVAPDSSSVTSTMASVIHYAAINKREQKRLLQDADKIARKFRIPEKRVWHIKVKAFSESNQWNNLRTLCDSKSKPPIGYKPFALAAIRGKQSVNDILRYVEKITVPEERYDLYCEANLWKLALDEAFRRKDTRRIMNVKTLCNNNNEIQSLAEQMISRIS